MFTQAASATTRGGFDGFETLACNGLFSNKVGQPRFNDYFDTSPVLVARLSGGVCGRIKERRAPSGGGLLSLTCRCCSLLAEN